MSNLAEALIEHLVMRDVEVVFGIPGVHTLELYRGVQSSGVRHVTPRHEQGAAFMADGYARVTGKPGVALLITGPGMTNALTAMAQARADSIPMLVISSVNTKASLGKGLGFLHELPNQQATIATIATSIRIESEADLTPAMDRVFNQFSSERPGPAHIELPLDVARETATAVAAPNPASTLAAPANDVIERASEMLTTAAKPVILAGGGVKRHNAMLQALATKLDAPVVLTTNARGLMHKHELVVPASASLGSVRNMISDADVVLAIGTELGRTDYDMYDLGHMPVMNNLIRVDICSEQLVRQDAVLKIHADAGDALAALNEVLNTSPQQNKVGATRAGSTNTAAFEEIGEAYRKQSDLLGVMRDTAPNSIIVGDSTQLMYACNLYYDHDRPGGWFNAATGYGALGYGIPAAIGAAIADPNSPVICITGDGGAQFSLPEIMAAVDEKLAIVFIVWNNCGYLEIENFLKNADVEPIGCDPTPPDFSLIAAACKMPYFVCDDSQSAVATTLKEALTVAGPTLLEIDVIHGTTTI
ncbi:MAG: 5-guanidino-2-oxopentanoate decarboxylase [Granulosicoccaceae bacterium]